MNIPINWKAKACEICMRESRERKEKEFYGLIGECKCEKCFRLVCQLHYNHQQKQCTDCFHHVGKFDKK
jgi:hypothetical protein